MAENVEQKEFDVPVWFRIRAETQEAAWVEMRKFLAPFAFPMDYVVEEPTEIKG